MDPSGADPPVPVRPLAGASTASTEPLTASTEPLTASTEPLTASTEPWTADDAVTRLFVTHYRPLVRLAALLLHDDAVAEEVAQDAFVALHGAWRRVREPDRAEAYLRQIVVNRCRSALRHRSVVDRFLRRQGPALTMPSAEVGAIAAEDHAEVLAALSRLPARQREALILRFYGDLSEAQVAEAMRISAGAVKSHTSRGLAALRLTMEKPT